MIVKIVWKAASSAEAVFFVHALKKVSPIPPNTVILQYSWRSKLHL